MRGIFRLILGASIAIALIAAGVSLWRLGPINPSAWATVAATLAVVAAVASAWTSQRVLELQEDALAPNPVPMIDVRSRYQLAQFRITNHGGSSAHNVQITWQQQLCNSDGKEVLLARDKPIPVIPERESASCAIGLSLKFIQKYEDTTFRGTATWENASGRKYSKVFVISAEHERVSLLHDEELPKTLWELQKIPDKLEQIEQALSNISKPK